MSSSILHQQLLFLDTPKAMQNYHRCKPSINLSTEKKHEVDQSVTTPNQEIQVSPCLENIHSMADCENTTNEPFDLINTTSQSIIFENVTLKDCQEIITDFEKYPEFLDGYFTASVIPQNPKNKFQVSFRSSFMFSTIDYSLQVKVMSPELIQFNAISSSVSQPASVSTQPAFETQLFKKHYGQWSLKDLKNGNIQATYFVNMELVSTSLSQQQSGIYLKHGICSSNMKEWLGRKYVPSLLEAFKRRIEDFGIRRKTQCGYNSAMKKHFSNQLCL